MFFCEMHITELPCWHPLSVCLCARHNSETTGGIRVKLALGNITKNVWIYSGCAET